MNNMLKEALGSLPDPKSVNIVMQRCAESFRFSLHKLMNDRIDEGSSYGYYLRNSNDAQSGHPISHPILGRTEVLFLHVQQ